jgi:UDP-3-O-[3-hydroxymyristoyl] N-acetylglucosamine deacetylase/3-hydroxyacyl-[acyl-carrier-protein] dehydratase
LRSTASFEGAGLFHDAHATLAIHPADPGQGIRFDITHGPRPGSVPADLHHLDPQPRHTVLARGKTRVETVEHLLAALAGMGVTDATVELTGTEVPMADGSARPFVHALADAGLVDADRPVQPLVVTSPVHVQGEDGRSSLVALPGPSDALEIVYTFEADPPVTWVKRQVVSIRLDHTDGGEGFVSQLAGARTFIFEHEAAALRERGWGGHLTHRDLLVIGDDGPIDNELRFEDELARHKVLDLVGDLALIGRPVCGRIVAHRSGHALNHKLGRALLEAEQAQADGSSSNGPMPLSTPTPEPPPGDPQAAGFAHLLHRPGDEAPLDIRKIQRILPHRFPMLLVDRVLELDGDKRAVGLKNVTMGDVFFLGHYPTQPIFPGVLIVEAMGQLGGILLSRKLEHTGKIAILLSMDGVKMRHPVTPGDQLVLVAEAVRVKTRTGHVRCRAYVADRLSAEADIKFMLVDADA